MKRNTKMRTMENDIQNDLDIEIDGIEIEISIAEKSIPGFKKRHFNKERENALIFCLERSLELTKGCLLLANAKLAAPLSATTRSLFEQMIWTCWIVLSTENSKAFTEWSSNELKRLARKYMTEGHAKVTDKETEEDKTTELLTSEWAKDISKRRPSFEQMAKEAGLQKPYIYCYGQLSMMAHGNIYNLDSENDNDILALTALVNVFMECVNLVVKNWIEKRKETPKGDIQRVLQITK